MNINSIEYLKKLMSYRGDVSLKLIVGFVQDAPHEALYIDCFFNYHTNQKIFKNGVWVYASKAEQDQLMGSLTQLDQIVENIKAIQRSGGIQCAKRMVKLKGGCMRLHYKMEAEVKRAIKDYNAVYGTETIEEMQERIDAALKYMGEEMERCKQTERNKTLPKSMQTQAFVIRERLQRAEEILNGGIPL